MCKRKLALLKHFQSSFLMKSAHAVLVTTSHWVWTSKNALKKHITSHFKGLFCLSVLLAHLLQISLLNLQKKLFYNAITLKMSNVQPLQCCVVLSVYLNSGQVQNKQLSENEWGQLEQPLTDNNVMMVHSFSMQAVK